MDYVVIFCSIALGFLIPLFRPLFWRPYQLTKFFRKQGVVGPPYQLISGSLFEMHELSKAAKKKVLDTNSNDISQRVKPHYHTWLSQYGKTFVFWYGLQPKVCIGDAELAKQTLSADKSAIFVKPKERPSIQVMVGKFGLILVTGTTWSKHRRMLNPAFSSEKIKGMVKSIAECTISMLDEWKQQQKIDAKEEFTRLTSDIITHIAFGISYVKGKEVLNAQEELQRLITASNFLVFIPGSQYMPTRTNFKIWKLQRNMIRSIKSIIESRLLSGSNTELSENRYGDDILGMMVGASESNEKGETKLSMDEIVDECKSFFFGGQESTSNLLTWTIFLLSIHQDWQQKLRDEVLNQCGHTIPDADMIANLKLVNMVVLETLRLYSPATEVKRQASQDTKLGNLMIPKGTQVAVRVMHIHRDKEYWGDDADEFNPLRFANGVSRASTNPNAFLAFGSGPCICIAQKLALLEAKAVMALLLQRFSWSLSNEYKHTPVDNLSLQPQFGLPILIKPLNP